ncbi:MAG: ATP-binding protein, partial [Lachnospiraceae bacterium]|nr:ATP-binding protein [Lachnospiraceae bacterium]
DLLKIGRDTVINIELKSHDVSHDRIKYQLQLNRNYLASLNRNIRSYTYLSGSDKLLRLSNSGNLFEESWDTLTADITGLDDCIEDNIGQFFREDQYIISPLTDPDRFLKGNYFLTSQQKDIKKQILSRIRSPKGDGRAGIMQGFMGLPGTGKTLLLYDLAMELTSSSKKACVLHFGSFPDEMKTLDTRLKRVDFYPCAEADALPELDGYSTILVDEGHRMTRSLLDDLTAYSSNTGIPVIISYDYEAIISPYERPQDMGEVIDGMEGFIKYRLTNRIRMNSELSSYICCMMRCTGNHRMKAYPSVSLYYANDEKEAALMLNMCTASGYTYISDNSQATCREFDSVVMLVDDTFSYDDEGFLRSSAEGELRVRRLFHGLNRARNALSVIVVNNPEVFSVLLNIAQG